MRKIDKIYVDMDGVIADFEKRYKELYGDVSESKRRSIFVQNFVGFIADENFVTLELMSDARKLITFLDSLDIPKEILSSTAHPDNYDEISRQKNLWLNTHNIAWKQNFVPGKQHKYKYATPNSIIIDDTLSVIYDWNKAGGIAIHHKNAHTTMAILEDYLSGSPK